MDGSTMFIIIFIAIISMVALPIAWQLLFPQPPSERQKELCTNEIYYYTESHYDYCDRIGVKP